jgi:putative transposase
MPRLARVVVPDLPHHVTQRGNRRQPTFFGDHDYGLYKAILAEQAASAGVRVAGWCLMPNHVHLILVPPTPTALALCLREVHRRYTRHVNEREGWRGYLWQGRFASCVMDEPHFLAALRYVEQNPVRAGLAPRPTDWRWSSARAHLHGQADGLTDPALVRGLVDDWAGFLAADERPERLEALRVGVRTGRPLGSPAFLGALEERLGRPLQRRRPGPRRTAAGGDAKPQTLIT